MSQPSTAVVIDLVRSRSHEDRRALQRSVVDALARVNDAVPALIPLGPTYADEFQGLYADSHSALLATHLVQLQLPDGTECRFGLGVGDSAIVDERDGRTILDGSAWWSARDAIETAKRREDTDLPWLRTWFTVAEEYVGRAGAPDAAITTAYLICRDELLAGLPSTGRAALLGRYLGRTQEQIATSLEITQSAVSRSLNRGNSAALAAATTVLQEVLP